MSEADERHRPKSKCPICKGVMWISGTYLITKHVVRDEHGDVEYSWSDKQFLTTSEQIREVRKHLTPLQQVLDGSEMCDCHPGKLNQESAA
jgi:hypothetical protein